MTDMVVTNKTYGNVVIEGDEGIPSVTLDPQVGSTAIVPMHQVNGNVRFCDEVAAYITAGSVTAAINGVDQTAAKVLSFKSSDVDRGVPVYGGHS